MTTLKEEEPFASVLKMEYLNTACAFCFTSAETVHKCNGCHVLAYCNEQCQESDWVNHQNECCVLKKSMESAGSPPDDLERLAIRILLKSKEELGQKAFNGRSWESLEHGGIPRDFVTGLNHIIELLKPVKKVSPDMVVKVLRKIFTNGMDIFESNIGVDVIGFGVYLGLSIHKHSCIPDSQLIFNGKKASLRAFDERAEYSPHLTISYPHCPPWTPKRRHLIKKGFYFDCSCPLCTDENHIMNRMGSSCYVNCCEDGAGILDQYSSAPFRCNKCGKASPISVDDVKLAEEKIKYFLKGNAEFDKIMNLLLTSETILSLYNFQFINLCKNVRSISLKTRRHGTRRFAQDKEQKAVEYYLHETDRRRATFFMNRTFLKYTLKNFDYFDEFQAVQAAERAFGSDNPVFTKFKTVVEQYQNFTTEEQNKVNKILNSICVIDPLRNLFL